MYPSAGVQSVRRSACVTVRSVWSFSFRCNSELSLFERRTFSSFCSPHSSYSGHVLGFLEPFARWARPRFRSLALCAHLPPLLCSRASFLFQFCRKRVPISAILAQICGCERFFVSLMGFSAHFDICHAYDLVFCRWLFTFRKNHRSQPQICAKTRRKRTRS